VYTGPAAANHCINSQRANFVSPVAAFHENEPRRHLPTCVGE
jgi:hypothetical protein